MSKTDFQTLLQILNEFKFEFEFSTPEWYMKDSKKNYTGRKEDMHIESGLVVKYKNTERSGSFKLMISTLDPTKQAQLYNLLETSPNRVSGTVPEELKDELLPENEKPVKLYELTGEKVYFDKETLFVETGDIDLNYCIPGTIVKVPELPGYQFVKHGKIKQNNTGFSLLYNGFLISVSTKEYKENPKSDPLRHFIDRMKGETPETLQTMLKGLRETMDRERVKILTERTGKTPETLPEPSKTPESGKTTENPVKSTISRTTQTPDPTKNPGKFLVWSLLRVDLDPETLIFQSWGVSGLKIDSRDPENPFISFNTSGFLWEGSVRVSYTLKKDRFTVELIDNGETLVNLPGVKLDELQTVVDCLVEYDGDQNNYLLNVQENNPAPIKLPAAA